MKMENSCDQLLDFINRWEQRWNDGQLNALLALADSKYCQHFKVCLKINLIETLHTFNECQKYIWQKAFNFILLKLFLIFLRLLLVCLFSSCHEKKISHLKRERHGNVILEVFFFSL